MRFKNPPIFNGRGIFLYPQLHKRHQFFSIDEIFCPKTAIFINFVETYNKIKEYAQIFC